MDQILFTRQRHEADRAGLHYDYRLVVGDKAYSWATKKELPEPGKAVVFWEQPVHTREYSLSKKIVIPKGNYGAGTTTLDFVRKAQLNSSDKGHFTITTTQGEKYLLKPTPEYGEKAWLFKNLTKVEKNKNKYLEKISTTIHMYQHDETGRTTWLPEGEKPGRRWSKTGVSKHIKRKSL